MITFLDVLLMWILKKKLQKKIKNKYINTQE